MKKNEISTFINLKFEIRTTQTFKVFDTNLELMSIKLTFKKARLGTFAR